ncbi:hypothetical protein ALC62_08706, partial [Cyphomyrmex costatus]
SNMTGCTAPGCTNSDEKGFIMKIFPRDPVRRAQWTAQVGRKDWTPTDRSFLCEVSSRSSTELCLRIFSQIDI